MSKSSSKERGSTRTAAPPPTTRAPAPPPASTPAVNNNNNNAAPEPPGGDDFLNCPVCTNEFNQPKMLPCLHSFCFECLQSSLEQSGIGPGQAFLCPICKTQCTVPPRGVRSMKTNIFLVTLQEFFHSKTLDANQECDACEAGRAARKKCIECNDWLCNQCCAMHSKVKITKDHHLVSTQELQSGKYDELIKESFEPLMCGKHNEPLRLYCTDPGCSAPICTVCKTTLGHDGHHAIDLTEQAVHESELVRSMLPHTQRCIASIIDKVENLVQEEKLTAAVRKRMHKAIDDRSKELIEKLVKQIQDYGDGLHKKVEELSKEHRRDVLREAEEHRNRLQAAQSAKTFADTLIGFNRAEETVAISKEVRARLEDFQKAVDPSPPVWRQPRLNPPLDLETDALGKLFGPLTFEGEIVKSALIKVFSGRTDYDEKDCALCDISLDRDGNLVVVDRDNRKVKVFDMEGHLLWCTDHDALKAPNRVVALRNSGAVLVKDDKVLRLISPDGIVSANPFGDAQLKQPVGLAQSAEGEVLVTDWMGGVVVGFDERGMRVRSFPCSCEAPGYVTAAPNGNIAVSDWKQNVVKIFNSNGKFVRQFGEHGAGEGQLDHPYGVCADKFNHLLVSDTWNNRIQLLSDDGHFISTILNKDDGIEWPQAVAVDKQGRLIVVEQRGLVKIFQYIA